MSAAAVLMDLRPRFKELSCVRRGKRKQSVSKSAGSFIQLCSIIEIDPTFFSGTENVCLNDFPPLQVCAE